MGKVLYAAAAYALFGLSIVWAIGFLANAGVHKTIDLDVRPAASFVHAFAVDVFWIAAFATQHSVMARPAFKHRWTRIVPVSIERATYVLAASVVLLALLALWEPMPAVVWHLDSVAARLSIWGLYGIGWLIVSTSTFLIDHLHLFGLKQALAGMRGEVVREPTFRKILFYRLVRHPLMVGFLVVFWATPSMTVGHLVFAFGMTSYILIGVRLEESDLRAALGPSYDTYREEVRMLLPLPRRPRERL